MRQTCILERRPLIDAGRDQNDSAEHLASARHHGVEQGRALKRPLRRGSDKRETDPARRYPVANQPVAANGLPCADACRPTRA
jgi:hypothetical protein